MVSSKSTSNAEPLGTTRNREDTEEGFRYAQPHATPLLREPPRTCPSARVAPKDECLKMAVPRKLRRHPGLE